MFNNHVQIPLYFAENNITGKLHWSIQLLEIKFWDLDAKRLLGLERREGGGEGHGGDHPRSLAR